MSKNRYCIVTPNILVFNPSGYAKIRPHLISGVVTKRRNLFYIQNACHVPQENVFEIIRSSTVVSSEVSCATCMHRIRFFAGSCGFRYHPKVHAASDLLYLTQVASSLHIHACPHLASYVRLSEFPGDNTDEFVGDWSFAQYLLGIHLWEISTKPALFILRLFRFRKRGK